jgi:ankyrin repeat protein
MKASWDGTVEIARYLIARGADVNFANADGETALHQAIGREQTAVVELLLASGAHTDAVDTRGFWPIHKAAAAGNVEIVNLLARAKSPLEPEMYGLTPLMFAVSAGKGDTVRALVAAGAAVNYASRAGNAGQTALYSAIQTGSLGMAKLLLELGADPQARLADGTTLLAQARNGDQKELERLLIAAGAGAGEASAGGGELADGGSDLTLEQAIDQKRPAAVRALLAAGVDPNQRLDDYGTTLLHRAVDSGETEIVRALLEGDADPNVANKYQITPLMSAALEGRLEMVRAFIGHGAKVVAREPNGGSALMYAVLRGHRDVVRLLIQAGADVERDRAALLEIARREGFAEIVTLLEAR